MKVFIHCPLILNTSLPENLISRVKKINFPSEDLEFLIWPITNLAIRWGKVNDITCHNSTQKVKTPRAANNYITAAGRMIVNCVIIIYLKTATISRIMIHYSPLAASKTLTHRKTAQ